MFLSDLSVRRPVVATVMMLALVTLGLFSFRRLSIDLMPDVESYVGCQGVFTTRKQR